MKCKEAEVLIMEYFDGGLIQEKIDMLFEHLSDCPSCKEEFESMEAVLEAVESLPVLDPGICFTKNVMLAIGKRKWKIRAENYLGNLMWAAALFAFMIFTRDFFNSSLNGLANTSVVTGFENIFSDLPGKFSFIMEKTLYFRDVLLSEYLTLVILLLVTLILTNLALGKIVFGKTAKRTTV